MHDKVMNRTRTSFTEVYAQNLSTNCDLTFHRVTCLLLSTHCLAMMMICAKLFPNTTMQDEVMRQTRFWNTHTRTGKSRKENPQKLTQLSSRSHPRHLVGKKTAQKDTIIDTTSDSQVNSNFPNRWLPASLTFNNYFYLFLYLYIT